MPRIPEPFIRRDYRGLNDAEDKLLRTYLRQRDEPVTGLETNVFLGPGEDLPAFVPDSFRKSWKESSKLKADAIVHRPSIIEIVELKDFIRTAPLGQVLQYRYWYELEKEPDKPIQGWVTAPDINPSAVQPTQFHGVNLHLQEQRGEVHYQQGLQTKPPFDEPDDGLPSAPPDV